MLDFLKNSGFMLLLEITLSLFCLPSALQARNEIPTIPLYEFLRLNGDGSPEQERYRMVDHPTAVFVFEAYRNSCGACSENASQIHQLADEYKLNPRVQILDLSLDSTHQEFDDWIRRHSPAYPVILDEGFRVFRALRSSSGVPQTFVVNHKGELLGSISGTWDDEVRDKVRRMIEIGLIPQR